MAKPDIVLRFSSNLIVVVEADDDDGHSVARGNKISKYGAPWEYDRDLNAELAKMQSVANALHTTYRTRILYIRVNSDNKSLRMRGGDLGCVERVLLVAAKIDVAEASTDWPAKSFRLAHVDMPRSRRQQGQEIAGSDDVFIPLVNIQQTINPTSPATLKRITTEQTAARKKRRAEREL